MVISVCLIVSLVFFSVSEGIKLVSYVTIDPTCTSTGSYTERLPVVIFEVWCTLYLRWLSQIGSVFCLFVCCCFCWDFTPSFSFKSQQCCTMKFTGQIFFFFFFERCFFFVSFYIECLSFFLLLFLTDTPSCLQSKISKVSSVMFI